MRSFLLILTSSALWFQSATNLSAQSPSVACTSATVTFGSGSTIEMNSPRGRFPLVGLNAGDTVTIGLQISGSTATTVSAQSLDGGSVTNNVPIASDGSASLQFQAGAGPGLYRISVNSGGATCALQFWVIDPNNSANTPPVLTPQS